MFWELLTSDLRSILRNMVRNFVIEIERVFFVLVVIDDWKEEIGY